MLILGPVSAVNENVVAKGGGGVDWSLIRVVIAEGVTTVHMIFTRITMYLYNY